MFSWEVECHVGRLSLAPGFSRVEPMAPGENRFNGFHSEASAGEAVEPARP